MAVAYLTIDDGPSVDFERKVSFLRAHDVPAVFFCIGEQLERRSAAAVHAIRDGFLIGNHSYSHPRFSGLSAEEAEHEIAKTDAIIESLYAHAGCMRPMKLFRFPYGDRGARHQQLDGVLKKMGYVGLRIPRPRVPLPFVRWLRFRNIDCWWTFDVRDWCLAHTDHPYAIHSRHDVIARLQGELTARWDRVGSNHVFLLHDNDDTGDLFEDIIHEVLDRGVAFTMPQ